MKTNLENYHKISLSVSRNTTKRFSTSFSWAIGMLHPTQRDPIYAIYGFVRIADEIVDSFHGHDQKTMFTDFKRETYRAIADRISANPILNSFQWVVNKYNIDHELIDAFLYSMEMDLYKQDYDRNEYNTYIYGSAEVVGLMCMFVFCEGNRVLYDILKPSGQRLGAAFQKINFLRDLNADFRSLGRIYFPNVNLERFSEEDKKIIEQEIEADFEASLDGIRKLPQHSRVAVYLAFIYFYSLFIKIKHTPAHTLINKRIRIGNVSKIRLLFSSYLRDKFDLIGKPASVYHSIHQFATRINLW